MIIAWILDEVCSGNVLVCGAVALCVIVGLWEALLAESEFGGLIWVLASTVVGAVVCVLTLLISAMVGAPWESQWPTMLGGFLFMPMLFGFLCIPVRIFSFIWSRLGVNRHG